MKNIIMLLISILIGCGISNAYADASVGGTFTLTNQFGKNVSEAEFRGKYMLLFFGFTNCPDLCPTTLLIMSQALEQLKGNASKVAPIFVSIDPERDSPTQMKAFLSNFNPAIIGLTGTQQQIDEVQNKYKTYSLKVEDKDAPSGHSFDHSGYIYLMDKQGKFLTVFTADSSPKTIAKKIEDCEQKDAKGSPL